MCLYLHCINSKENTAKEICHLWEEQSIVKMNLPGEGRGGKEMCVPIKGQHEGSLSGWKYSVSWLYQCQYPGCNIVNFCKMLPLGKTRSGLYEISVLFPTNACESIIISKQKSFIEKENNAHAFINIHTSNFLSYKEEQLSPPFILPYTVTLARPVALQPSCTFVPWVTSNSQDGWESMSLSPTLIFSSPGEEEQLVGYLGKMNSSALPFTLARTVSGREWVCPPSMGLHCSIGKPVLFNCARD